ncbi:MAG: thiamine diphosphokinase, partial [Christensenellaceae bacterium]|nr:thiamine diphosphokinase [Christensenellaceae bacterium]
IICADGGYNHAVKNDLEIDYIVGDNDSIINKPDNIKSKNFSKDKNETDMHLSLNLGRKLNFKYFRIYGGYGNRPDHFFANIQLLIDCSQKKETATLVADKFNVYVLNNSSIIFNQSEASNIVSIFSLNQAAYGVKIKGLKYELEDSVFYDNYPIGTSNETTGKDFFISVKNGKLIVFCYDKISNNKFSIKYYN